MQVNVQAVGRCGPTEMLALSSPPCTLPPNQEAQRGGAASKSWHGHPGRVGYGAGRPCHNVGAPCGCPEVGPRRRGGQARGLPLCRDRVARGVGGSVNRRTAPLVRAFTLRNAG